MRKDSVFFLFCLLFLAAVPVLRASEDPEVIELRRRVAELEKQNQQILQMLQELKARLPEKQAAAASPVPRPSEPARPGESQAPAKPPAPSALAVVATPPAAKAADDTVRWAELTSSPSHLKFYGFLRVDNVVDDSRMNNPQSVMWVLPEDRAAGSADLANFTLYPRLTRFGINFSGPMVAALGNAKLSGQLEIDFQNGGSESRPTPRIRHGWLKLTKGNFAFLGGQTWDIFGPLFPTPNTDTLMWNVGNVGDRRPQLQATYSPQAGKGQFLLAGSVGLSSAVDAMDLDANGYRDGEESARPNVEARFGYAHPIRSGGPKVSVGFSGFRGWQSTTRLIAGRRQFYSQGLAADFEIPFHDRIALRGEGWWGRNMSDFRGGIGQNINTATGVAIRSRGGWAEFHFKAHRLWTLAPGYTLDDPVDQDVASGGRIRNGSLYFANRLSLGGGFLIGADYLHWITSYKNLPQGTDNRVNIFFQYSF